MNHSDESQVREFEFFNSYGERLALKVDMEQETAELTSDDFEAVNLENDRIGDGDLMLMEDEFAWLADTWRQLFGRELHKLAFIVAMDLIEELRRDVARTNENRTSNRKSRTKPGREHPQNDATK